MIRHVVVFKAQKGAPVTEFKTKIENLKHSIPEIIHIEVGIDIKFDKNPSDFCVITEVKDLHDLEIYATHPKHLEVIDFIKPYVLQRCVVDYEV
ncbi:MAG: Dabb family protein [Epsilonproteobacteria bacterium]|nr:Dabb family protein [Campylobacterota bacterium]